MAETIIGTDARLEIMGDGGWFEISQPRLETSAVRARLDRWTAQRALEAGVAAWWKRYRVQALIECPLTFGTPQRYTQHHW